MNTLKLNRLSAKILERDIEIIGLSTVRFSRHELTDALTIVKILQKRNHTQPKLKRIRKLKNLNPKAK